MKRKKGGWMRRKKGGGGGDERGVWVTFRRILDFLVF